MEPVRGSQREARRQLQAALREYLTVTLPYQPGLTSSARGDVARFVDEESVTTVDQLDDRVRAFLKELL